MQKYLFITSEVEGNRISEIHEISNEDLATIRPVIREMLDTPSKHIAEYTAYELYGHLDGFETFVKFAPSGENGAHHVNDIKLLELKEIML